jgi:N-acetylneuraminate epimerase
MLCLRWCNPFLGQAGWLICFWHTFYYLLHHENMIRKIIYGVYAILGMMTMAAAPTAVAVQLMVEIFVA